MRNPLTWLSKMVEESFEQRVERFEAFEEQPRKRKHSHVIRISPSKKLVWGTTLAILLFLCLFILELAIVLHLNTINEDLITGMLAVAGWVGGTYFGHRG